MPSRLVPGILAACTLCGVPASLQAAAPGTQTERILVDQFGYLPDAKKIAVLNDPQTGYNSAASYSPGATLEVRKVGTNEIVFSGSRTTWNGGAIHAQSGDKVWWFDFSSVTAWGEYYIYDPTTDLSSTPFRIDERVYYEVLRHSLRAFYYQRRGFAKAPPYTDAKWADGASHLGTLQDSQCRFIGSPGDAAQQKDLRGGWFDAGDYNKYTTFTYSALSDLLFAYRRNPGIWTDDLGIPESNNGVPDILDEIKWELDWLLRMQNANGSVLSKVAVTEFQNASPPSADAAQVFYGAASTSATLCTAASFAHAAIAFNNAGQTAYGTTLRNAAVSAWNWADANPSVTFTNAGFSSANPEVSAYERSMYKLCAAIFLYELTGEAAYKTYVEANYTAAQPMQWGYWYAFEAPLQDALIHYSSLANATSGVKTNIRNSKQGSMGGSEFLPAYTGQTDAYRAYVKDADMVWGSNRVKSHAGIIFANQVVYGVDTANATHYRDAAAGFLHYIHGVNPIGITYLTNMYAYGAERSVNQIYHAWFTDGGDWDHALTSPKGPPPGYLTGGPNKDYAPNGAYSGPLLAPPLNQPTLKAFKDWNSSAWQEESWEVAEPGIYYQAAYIHLLSRFVRPLTYAAWAAGYGLATGTEAQDPDGDGLSNLEEMGLSTNPLKPNVQSLSGQLTGGNLALSFPRQSLTKTLSIKLRTGITPGNWSDSLTISTLGTRSATATETIAASGLRQLQFNAPATGDRGFYRLEFTLTE